jgi:phage terminase large subunit-like protein
MFGDLYYPPEEIIVEFVSYNQQVQAGAGVQRLSVWCDEEPPHDFYEEQLPRLLAENGDFIISLTPANRITWTYDELFEKASLYLRTKSIVDFYKKNENRDVKRIERNDSPHDIAVVQAATDDNPTLRPDVINELFDAVDDPDALAIRRYGIFKQTTGRIFKDFAYPTHCIDPFRHFPDGRMFGDWVLARLVDYHESIPWAIIWVALSPHDEAFVYDEWNPSPEKYVNITIAEEVASRSEQYRFIMNLFDPLAAKVQTNTGISTIEDFNRLFYQLKHEGIGSGGFWQPWDTKSTRGRDAIRMRLKNASKVGVPFNNTIIKEGVKTYLPTLWIWNNCREMSRSLKQWRLDEWANSRSAGLHEKKETPGDKYSHFCTALEAAFKDQRFRARQMNWNSSGGQRSDHRFQGRG